MRFAISVWRYDIVDSRSSIVNTRYYIDHLDMNEMKNFGQLLKEGRARKGLTAEALAKLVGIGSSVLSEMETGKRTNAPDALWVRSFSEVLGIPVERMLIALGYLDENQADDEESPAIATVRAILGNKQYSERQLEKLDQFFRSTLEIVESMEG